MRIAIFAASTLLAACAPAADKAASGEHPQQSAFSESCNKTLKDGWDSKRAAVKGAGERAAMALMSARIPSICACADQKLKAEFDARKMKFASELMPVAYMSELAKDRGVEARRAAAKEARNAAAAIASKYGLGLRDLETVITKTRIAVAMCAAPQKGAR